MEIGNMDVNRSKCALVPKIVSQEKMKNFSFILCRIGMTNASYVQVDISAPRDLGHDIYKKELTVSIHLNFQDQYHIMYLKM